MQCVPIFQAGSRPRKTYRHCNVPSESTERDEKKKYNNIYYRWKYALLCVCVCVHFHREKRRFFSYFFSTTLLTPFVHGGGGGITMCPRRQKALCTRNDWIRSPRKPR